MDTYERVRQSHHEQMLSRTKTEREETQDAEGTIDTHTNSEQLEFECQLKTPTRSRMQEILNLGASSSHNLLQSLITNQDLLRLREDMWCNHRTQRKGWWCRAFSKAINRQCPTCNRLWTMAQFPPLCNSVLHALRMGRKRNLHNSNSRQMRRASSSCRLSLRTWTGIPGQRT